MLILEAQTELKKSFLSRRHYASVKAQLFADRLHSKQSPIAVASLLNNLLQLEPMFLNLPGNRFPEIEGSGEIINCRGRPFESQSIFNSTASNSIPVNSTSSQPKLQSMEEELFFIKGEFLSLPEAIDQWPPTVAQLCTKSFHWAVKTRFKQYLAKAKVSHHIYSSGHNQLSQVLQTQNTSLLSELVPFQVTEVRIGFDSYRPHQFGSMLGRLPKISGRFYLEISSDKLSLLAEEDMLENYPTSIPYQQLLNALGETLLQQQLFTNLVNCLKGKLYESVI